ncbi:MAG: ABC transporter ATP-binding protein [Clostridia bacterium]|nr:ABC transporter ATP-binding protein [Clostridia bacterium]
MSKPILEVKALRTSFHTRGKTVQAVRGIDLTVREGEILGIVGESGSGKSVSMKSVIRLVPPSAAVTADSILLDGVELTALTEKQMRSVRGGSVSMIFQDPMTSLDPLKRVGAHIGEVLRRHLNMRRAEARQEAVSLLRKVGVPSPETRVDQYPHEFSGGMRQRVLIAMALACHPKLLIADEPTTALDVTIQAQILDLIRDLQRQDKMSVILITHDLGVVAQLCHRIAVMYGGLILEEGTTEEIFESPAHPYTQALLRSIPSIDETGSQRLQPIEGHAPSLIVPPPGCPFAPRCPRATAACVEGIPALERLSDTHSTRCPFHRKEETP